MDAPESQKTGKPVLLCFLDHPFEFEPIPERQFVGRLVLDSEGKELLTRFNESRPDSVDENGYRLPAEQLFEQSPWTWRGPKGTVKLLMRFLDYRDGSAIFDTPNSYFGPLFDWLQPQLKPKS